MITKSTCLHLEQVRDKIVDIYASPMADSSEFVVLAFRERSVADKIDRQLSHQGAARSVTGLAAMLAHEIKNPLSGIRGAAQLLEEAVGESDRNLTQLITKETDRIVKIVNRMEVFSDESLVTPEAVNMHSVLEHVKQLAQNGFAKNITISEHYDPSLPLVAGDHDQLVQAFLNLIKNAAEALNDQDNGQIILSSAYRPGFSIVSPVSRKRATLPLEFSISDNGPGIPDEIRSHIFEPFVTSRINGSGLGLALVAKIIGRHGGIIECDSQPGTTTFRVLLSAWGEMQKGKGNSMSKGVVLVADDDAAIRTVVNQALSRAGFDVRVTSNASTLWRWVSEGEGDVVVSDVIMPDGDAFELLPKIKQLRPSLPVIVMSAQNTFMTAVKASESGAYEYLPKPFDLGELIAVTTRAVSEPKDNRSAEKFDEYLEGMPLVGRSAPMQEIYRSVARLMQSDLTVMLSGEPGTGKLLAAKVLHQYGNRKNNPFVAVNLATLPQETIEAELFGRESNSADKTGSDPGRLRQAAGGILFLKEIGELPPGAQSRLLRVLQSGEFTPVGGSTPVKSDVKVVAATTRDMDQMIRNGMFREDLFYRLNVVPLRLPPLRERLEDVADLVSSFPEACRDGWRSAKAC